MKKPRLLFSPSKSPALRLSILASISLISLGFAWFTPATKGIFYIHRLGYSFLLIIFALFIFAIVQLFKERKPSINPRKWFTKKRYWLPLLALLLGTAFLRTQGEPGYTILFDESSQAATALGMHLKREVYMPFRAHTLSGVYCPLGGNIDKRPPLFPFLISLLHDFTGYRFANIFWVNALLTPLLLTLSFLIGAKLGGWKAGIGVILTLVSFPLLGHVTHGGGFEPLFLTLIAACLYLSIHYLKKPNASSLWALSLTCVLLVETRYEAALFVFAVIAVVLIGWAKAKTLILPWRMMLIPLFFIPAIWHHRLFEVFPHAWELSSKPAATHPFGLHYIHDNFGHALSFFFGATPYLPNSLFLGLGGTLTFIGFIIYSLRRLPSWRTWSAAVLALAIFEVAFLSLFLLFMAYFWGQLDDPIIMRLALPFALAFALPLVFFAFHKQAPKGTQLAFWLLSGANLFLWTLPRIAQSPWVHTYSLLQDAKIIEAFAIAHKDEHCLVLSGAPTLWVVHKIDTLDLGYAPEKKQALQTYLERPNHPTIYIQEWIQHDKNGNECLLQASKIISPIRKDPAFITEEVLRAYSSATLGILISRLIRIDGVEAFPIPLNETRSETQIRICQELP